MDLAGAHGRKRFEDDGLDEVQAGNLAWWSATPMSYDWRANGRLAQRSPDWFADQDRRFVQASHHFANNKTPFDRVIPFDTLRGKRVLEIGVGTGFHASLFARAGALVTGIDLTQPAVEHTRKRFALDQLEGAFEQWDAECPREDFERRFDYIWSWGVVHHTSRTARVVRNVHQWLNEDGTFAGMVYHRDSMSLPLALISDWLVRGNLLKHSIDEALWRSTDGYSARFYPADQWRDLLLGFFDHASVRITGGETDYLPLPRRLRRRVAPFVPAPLRDWALGRWGTFIIFEARKPL